MLYKNDNSEELFQKAARDYPLKTDSSDWETLADKMNRSGQAVSVNDKYWKYAAIFLLLAGGTLILNKYQDNSKNSKINFSIPISSKLAKLGALLAE